MNKLQCPHCFTDYKISDEQLRLSQGIVRCGKCMETFDANLVLASKETVFDPREAFIEPLSHIEEDRKGVSVDDILADSREVEFKDGSVIKLDKSVVKESDDKNHNNDHALELASILKKRKKTPESSSTEQAEAPEKLTRPRLNESSAHSIKDSFDPELSVNLDDDDLIYNPNGITGDDNEDSINEPSLFEDSINHESSHVMLPSTALDAEVEEYFTEQSIQIFSDRMEPELEEPSVQVEPTRLKSRLQTAKETPEKQDTPKEPSIELPKKVEPAILPEQQEIQEAFLEQESETIPVDDEPLEQPSIETKSSNEVESTPNQEVKLIDEVDQLIDDKLVNTPLENSPEADDLFAAPKKKKAASRFFAWLILSPLYLLLIILLSVFLIYQLWQKQLISWPDRKEVRALIEPAREPVLNKLDEFDISIPERRNLSALQLLSAKAGPHPTRSSTILLKVSLINRAQIEQPLPWLELSLKNSDGKVISRRSLSPDDYVHNNRISAEIGPRELKKITIELLSFPKHAAGYELRLLNK